MGDEENDYDRLAKDVRGVALLFVQSMVPGGEGVYQRTLAVRFNEALSALSGLERRCVGLADAYRLYAQPKPEKPVAYAPDPNDEYEIRTLQVLHRSDDSCAVEGFMDAMSDARDDENTCIEWRMHDLVQTVSREQACHVVGSAAVYHTPPVVGHYELRLIDVLHRADDVDAVGRFMAFIGRAQSDGLFVGCSFLGAVSAVSRREAESRLYTTIEEGA